MNNQQNHLKTIILVRPQMGENIGAAARGMLNFGLRDLRLVAPRDGWPNRSAIDLAAGAFEKMPAPQVFDTLQEAVADLHKVYATTARRRDVVKPVFTPQGAAGDAASPTLKYGFVFGPERTGLENDEIALCQGIINIPTNPDFSSLNLGQSVLLIAAALHAHGDDTPAQALEHGESGAAAQDKLEGFLVRLEGALEDGGFFNAKNLKPTMVRNIRAIFTRADLSDQEVRTLHGVITALSKREK